MQKDVIIKMYEEKNTYEQIRKELVRIFGLQAYSRSTIYAYIQAAKLGFSSNKESLHTGNPVDEQLLAEIQREVQDDEFFSVRSLAHKLNASPSIVFRYLTKYLHYVYRHSKWIPHQLNLLDQEKRKALSEALYTVLRSSKHDSYRNIITGDQSWFIYNYAPEGKWVLEDDGPPIFCNSRICNEKMMITVIWGVHGTYIVDELPQGMHLDSKYFVEKILMPLEGKKDEIWPSRGRHKIWLHLDNCRVHNSRYTQDELKKTVFKRTPHPPYSPDLAPSDFFLFGYVKGKLKGRSFTDRSDLYEEIFSIIDAIPVETKRDVFDEWADRCQWVYTNNGKYFIK